MKKILMSLLLVILLITGCETAMETPTKKVEELLGRYQSMDSEVLSQLDNVIEKDTTMNDKQKKEYRSLMERQYQNLSYKIKDEEIDGDNAKVLVEIEVFDYVSSINKSKEYYKDHQDEFKKKDTDTSNTPGTDEDENGSVVENAKEAIEDTVEFIDYKIKELKNVTDKVSYEITFHLTRIDDKWQVDDISDIDRQKIHGLYEE